MKKRMLCLLLAAMLLTSCGSGDNTVSGQTEDTQVSTAATEQTGQEQSVPMLSLIVNGEFAYKVTRAEESNTAIISDVTALYKNLEKYTGAKIRIETDFTRKGDAVDNSKPEILVGETNRQATQDLLAVLPPHSYGIRITEDKVVIVGTNENMTALGLYAF